MFDKLKSRINGKRKGIVNQDGTQWHVGEVKCGVYGSIASDGAYDNIFPDVSRIAEQISTILPYAVDANGERLKEQPQAVQALYRPNKEWSGCQFFETIATMALVHPAVYIKVDFASEAIEESNIIGYRILEAITPRRFADGTIVYQYDSGSFTDKEVIAISLNVNPYAVLDGYSPTQSAKKWATLDDYIVSWQHGFFKNNAIPAGEFIITARDADEFNAIVDEMELKHKGAGRNNNVSYVHRPTSAIDGKPLPAQIEWVPFSQSARDMNLNSIFDQANKKTAMAFGVPEEIKGFVSNSNYASVATAERIFDKYTILPKATKIWAQFTHELNRITGGLGYALSFDYEPAQSADENRVNAETTRIQLETLRLALATGFALENAVDALELPQSFKKLVAESSTETEEVMVPEEGESEVSQAELSHKKITKAKTVASDDELRNLLETYTEEQIEDAIEGKEFNLEKKANQLAKDLFPIIVAGAVLYALGKEKELEMQALSKGYDVTKLTTYEPSEDFRDTYLKYLGEVAFSYTSDTAEAIRQTFEMAHEMEFSAEETNSALRELLPTQFWRIRRLQRTESHRSNQMASLDMARQATKELGIEDGATKTWHVNPMSLNHCPLCEALDGTTLPLGASFEEFADANELGKFSAGAPDVADGHPNCECYLTFELPEAKGEVTIENETITNADEFDGEKSVKVKCPKCKRYICEATKSAKLTNVVCPRCGEHFDKESE